MLKHDKFNRGDGIFGIIRAEFLPNGKIIAFCIAGTDLSIIQNFQPIPDIDFDKESDEIIEKNRDTQNNLTFEYVQNFGFDPTEVDQQNWFKFR